MTSLQGATVRNLDVRSRTEDSNASFPDMEFNSLFWMAWWKLPSKLENQVKQQHVQRHRSLGSRVLGQGSAGLTTGASRGPAHTLHLNSSGSVPAPWPSPEWSVQPGAWASPRRGWAEPWRTWPSRPQSPAADTHGDSVSESRWWQRPLQPREGCSPAPPQPADLCEDGNTNVLPAGFVDEFCELLRGKGPRKECQDTNTMKVT